jgi:lipopolysaccharide transport system permease protein
LRRPAAFAVEARRPFRYPEHMNIITPDAAKADQPAFAFAGQSAPQITIKAAHSWASRLRNAVDDVAEMWRLLPLVFTLSFLDIKLRYRGSLLGPFWLTLSTAVMVGAIGFLYASLFHQDVSQYLPFLTISLVLWNFFNTITAEGCTCFTSSEGMIRAMRMPLSLHAARIVIRNIIVLAHNIIVIVIVFAIFHTTPNLDSFSVLPASLLWTIDSFATVLLLGAIGARFRDIPPIIGSIVQIAFYLTPIMWAPSMLAHRGIAQVFINWNPIFALLEIIRGPLLGQAIEPHCWLVACLYSVMVCGIAFYVFTRARPRIAYWV